MYEVYDLIREWLGEKLRKRIDRYSRGQYKLCIALKDNLNFRADLSIL
jgi:hypothetical protein